MSYDLMEPREMRVLEKTLSRDYIDSEARVLSAVAEQLMHMHPIITDPDNNSRFRKIFEESTGRIEVMQRAYIGVIGYFADIVHGASPNASVAYLSFEYEGGNQIVDVLRSSGVSDRIES
jgi:hypothetical protein